MSILYAQVTVFPWREHFNISAPPGQPPAPGWLIVDQDGDGHNWGQITTLLGVSPLTGVRMAISRSFITIEGVGTSLNPDNWLISPQIMIPEGSNPYLRYHIRSLSPTRLEHYGLFISTTGNAIGDFTRLLSENAPGLWTERVINISDYAGQNIYLAFRHYNSADRDVLFLDSVEIELLHNHDLIAQNITGATHITEHMKAALQ